ncbi:MAG: peptidylprolyl isomerase [Candidatus Dormibacteraeota bacterium]|nr:peptidylprolyl isomerase [Candidatus Dormibacteraeota bacterium]
MGQPSNQRNTPLLIAAGTVVVAAIVAVAVGFNHAANSGVNRQTETPSAAASSTATPTPGASQVPYADCTTATFGSPLAPLNQPSDPHVYATVPGMSIDQTKLYEATITTANRGTIVVCLQPNLAPQTVNVFVTLSRNHFYDGIPWHRVVAAFIIQAGDPSCIGNVQALPATPSGTCGSGGPGFHFDDEPVKQQYVDGSIAMANSGANTNGSQFFISSADNSKNLQPQYNLFGKVATGLDVVGKIQQGDIIQSITVTEQQ